MVQPQTRSEAAGPPKRVDPAPRPIMGIPTTDIAVDNKDPTRRYLLVAKTGVGYLTPDYYEALGWQVERWASFEGIPDGPLRQTAEQRALRFTGTRLGRPGEPIERMDCILMSIDAEQHAAFVAAQQKTLDPIEQRITDPDFALREARENARGLGQKAKGIGVHPYDGMEGA